MLFESSFDRDFAEGLLTNTHQIASEMKRSNDLKEKELCPIKVENKAEFIGQIVDVFDDFLEEKDVLFSETKSGMDNDGFEDSENSARLYGENYDILYEGVEKILENWNLVKKD